jgi:spermidine/putrescine transport system substrate-binding protein
MADRAASPVVLDWNARLSRRRLLACGLQLGGGLSMAAILAACSSSSNNGGQQSGAGRSSSAPTGTITMNNYPGWIGETEISDFESQFSDSSVKIKSEPTESIASDVLFFKQHPGDYDLGLEDQSAVGQMIASEVLQPIDFTNIPNIKYVDDTFRKSYSHGLPTDYGKVGVGYRKDIVTEGIISWQDIWDLAPKYSGQITFLNLDRDCMGSALKYLGYSGNSTTESELEACKNALTEIKPHLQALTNTNVASGLVKGTVAIAMDWDFDMVAAQQKEPNIEWVIPSEGAVAYLEGWIAVKGTDNLPLVEAFMNFHADPKNYAGFVNNTGTAYVESAATPYVDEAISKNPILFPDQDVLARVEYEDYLGEATALWSKIWDEFKSA